MYIESQRGDELLIDRLHFKSVYNLVELRDDQEECSQKISIALMIYSGSGNERFFNLKFVDVGNSLTESFKWLCSYGTVKLIHGK